MAIRMALLAEPLSAREAFEAGLITHVAKDAEFAATVQAVVDKLLAGPALAFAATKRAINAATLDHLDDALERERTSQSMLLRSDDVAEGMRAFSERRQPRFGVDSVPAPRAHD